MKRIRVVSWNCNGAFRKKYEALECLDADIYVIQECEDPERSTSIYKALAGEYLWTGSSKNKGVGIFARKDHALTRINLNDTFELYCKNKVEPLYRIESSELKEFLPCVIDGEIPLLGVWTKSNGSSSAVLRYIGQFWVCLQLFRDELSGEKQIICGDFNSNAIWDKENYWWNHSNVVQELNDINMVSLYHSKYSEMHGEETIPTFFMTKNTDKPYHIDYVFVNKCLAGYAELNILGKEWLEYSDHLPVVFEVCV